VLRDYRDHLGELQGKSIANLLGSHGRRAVALSLLGAKVTVVDISSENKRYATEVAEAAGVEIDYIVSDAVEWDTTGYLNRFDFALMEYGILHYFVDLAPLANLIYSILVPGGRMILHEFHPLIKKCNPRLQSDNLNLDGDYFSELTIEKNPPYHGEFSSDESEDFPMCRFRYWQMGEVITAVAASGLVVESLVENPHGEYATIPGTFTLVAGKQKDIRNSSRIT
jgi:SAM-dependent methyltransferase